LVDSSASLEPARPGDDWPRMSYRCRRPPTQLSTCVRKYGDGPFSAVPEATLKEVE